MGRQKCIRALTDSEFENGCYHPAHKETVDWRDRMENGFVDVWEEKSENSAEDFFRGTGKDG